MALANLASTSFIWYSVWPKLTVMSFPTTIIANFLFSFPDQYNSSISFASLNPLGKFWANKQACQKPANSAMRQTHASFLLGKEKCAAAFSAKACYKGIVAIWIEYCQGNNERHTRLLWILWLSQRYPKCTWCYRRPCSEFLTKSFKIKVSGMRMWERHWLISDCGIWRVEGDIWPRPQSRIILLNAYNL